MQEVHFIGTISPEAGRWWLEVPAPIQHGDEQIEIDVVHSSLNVRVKSADDTPPDAAWLDRLWRRTETVVRAALDSLGFHRGAVLDIRFISGSVAGGGRIYPLLNVPAFATPQDEDAGEVIAADLLMPYVNTASTNPLVRHALADHREARRLNEDSAFYCFRAIESLRQHFLADGVEDVGAARKRSWDQLREVLGVEREPIDEIRLVGNERRHGGAAAGFDIDQYAQYVMTTKGWIDTFVQYLNSPPATST